MTDLDYKAIEDIKKQVLEKYPDEPGKLLVTVNTETSPAYAYALFLNSETKEETVVETVGLLNYFGLPITVRRATPLTVPQLRGIIGKIKTYPD